MTTLPRRRLTFRPPVLVDAVAVVLLALAGCSSGSGSEAATTTAASGKATSTTAESTTSAPPDTDAQATATSFEIGLPEGWEQGEANDISELFVQRAAEPDVQLGVRSSPMAGGAAALAEYASGERDTLEAYTNTDEVTAPKELDAEVDGEPATALDWTFTADNSDGVQTPFQQRRIFISHAGQLYDVTFQAPADEFDDLQGDLDAMLATWTFT
ncbi:MAG: hypothetical protein ACTHN0_16855 [Aquihabitans sp.]